MFDIHLVSRWPATHDRQLDYFTKTRCRKDQVCSGGPEQRDGGLFTRRPYRGARYFCSLLEGLSGIVRSTAPASRAGLR